VGVTDRDLPDCDGVGVLVSFWMISFVSEGSIMLDNENSSSGSWRGSLFLVSMTCGVSPPGFG
jgi:hypothetical protein